jgi:LysR family transcriptional regulator, benzoate and cis,cis-muconate-responsive activator of ben and cat genes
MELRHLRYFVSVVNEGNFMRAAEKLNIAQPPLSRQIHQLEEQLGVRLLDRKARPLRMTNAGRFLYEHALHVLDRVEVMLVMTRRLGQVEKGRFGIGFVGSTLYGPLPELVRRFQAAYPDLEIDMVELTSIQQIAALKEGRIDVGFGRLPVEDPAVRREVLQEEAMVAALPIGHALLNGVGPLRLDDLASETLIVYPREPRPSYVDEVLSVFRDRRLEPRAIREVSELQTALGLVAAAVGICLAPASVQRLRRDDILYRDLDEAKAITPVVMCHRMHDSSRETIVLLQLIRELYQYGMKSAPLS